MIATQATPLTPGVLFLLVVLWVAWHLVRAARSRSLYGLLDAAGTMLAMWVGFSLAFMRGFRPGEGLWVRFLITVWTAVLAVLQGLWQLIHH